jgi:hypothetical protein
MDDSSKLHLILVPNPAEPHWTLPESQAGFRAVHRALLEADPQVFAVPFLTRDLGSASKLFGEFVLPLASTVGSIIGVAVGAWITGRAGRKLKLKMGDVELEANSPAEIEHLLKRVAELKAQLSKADKSL